MLIEYTMQNANRIKHDCRYGHVSECEYVEDRVPLVGLLGHWQDTFRQVRSELADHAQPVSERKGLLQRSLQHMKL